MSCPSPLSPCQWGRPVFAPRGFAHIVDFFGKTIGEVQKDLDSAPFITGADNGHQVLKLQRERNAIIITQLLLSPGREILHLGDQPYLRLSKEVWPHTILTGLPGWPLQQVVEAPVLPNDPTIEVASATLTPSRDTLLRIHWPQDPLVVS